MRKNIGILCLTLVMLVSIWAPGLAAEGAIFVVTIPEAEVAEGEIFDVTVELKNNPVFYAIQFTLAFDHDAMKCTGIRLGPLMENMLSVKNPNASNGAIVLGATTDGAEGDGLVATLRFRASVSGKLTGFSLEDFFISDADANSYEVSVRYDQGTETPSAGDPEEPWPEEEDPWGSDLPAGPVSGDAGSGSPAQGGAISPSGSGTEPSIGSGGQTSEGVLDPASQTAQSIDFPDIQNHWGREAILRAAELGLFKGYDDGRFGPNDPVTRVQLVTVLYRLSGSPETEIDNPFDDIGKEIPEFQRAVSWAYKNGYVNGRTETTFDPRSPISRQETMTILFRYSGGQSGLEVMFTSIYDDSFADSDQIASWAKKAVYWGVYKEIIKGTSEVTIDPKGVATRAQMATILVNYITKFVN